ncbi:MAG TPA: Uma2 family endonuclease [Terriglobia bacterium]|nr:Uma2 family endonuclease [Terriglobia bacterium]
MATKATISWEQFLAAGEESRKWEWVGGEVCFMTPVNFRHEIVLARVITYLVEYCRLHPEWIWVPSNAVFTMSSGNWRLPDASIVSRARLPQGRVPERRAEFSPDVAFEILSPGNTAGEVQLKKKDYQESGVTQVWIDLDKRVVELICPDRPLQFFREDQILVIDSLPGFSLDLNSLFTV